MKKRILSVLICVLLIFMMVPTAFASDDTTPPILVANSVSIDKTDYNAGDTITVRFQASDSESGINPAACSVSFNIYEDNLISRPFDIYGVTDKGGGWYEAQYAIPEKTTAGKFHIDHIDVGDYKKNFTTLYSKSGRENPDPKGTYIPEIRFVIHSSYNPDIPKITDFAMSKVKANVGDTVTFTVTAKTNSGIASMNLKLEMPMAPWYSNYNYSFDLSPVAGKPGTFQGKYKITADMPDTDYYPDITAISNAGGYFHDWVNGLFAHKNTVLNVNNPKVPLPKKERAIVTAYTMSSHRLIPGQKLTITANVAFKPAKIDHIYIGCENRANPNGEGVAIPNLPSVGNGKYAVTFNVPLDTRPGDYLLEGVGITLENGNGSGAGLAPNLEYMLPNWDETFFKGSDLKILPILSIKGTENIAIPIGSTFNPMAGVTATNAYTGDITNKVTVSGGNIDTSAPGVYLVKYIINDSITVDGVTEPVSYTDYRWIGVTEIMPGDTTKNLVVTDDGIHIGAGKEDVSLTRDGKAISYASNLTQGGQYTVQLKKMSTTGTSLTGGSSYAKMVIDRAAPSMRPSWNRVSDSKIRVNPAVSDPSGIAVSKWLFGKCGKADVIAKGKAFNGTFDVGKFGTYTVYTKDKQGYETCRTFTVKEIKLKKLTLNLDSAEWGTGMVVQLKVTFNPGNATDKRIKWSSSNKKVATVDSNGIVRVHKKGKATITVTGSNGKKAACKIKSMR